MKNSDANLEVKKQKGKFTLHRTTILFLIPFSLILISLYFYFINNRFISTDDAQIKIGISIISPQVSGVTKAVKIKNNQLVKKGDVIFEIDDNLYKIKVVSARMKLNGVVNNINSLKAAYNGKKAQLESAKADLIYYQKQFERTKMLREHGSAPQEELDLTTRQLANSTQAVNNIEASLSQELANLDGNIELDIDKYSLFLSAKANFDLANLDLTNTIICAPFDGIVSNLYLKEGNFVSQGVPLFSIIDYQDIWIEANFKEIDLANIKVGKKAKIEIDSFPNKKFDAKVVSITKATGSEFSILPAQNTSGNWVKVTQRIMVRLEFMDNIEFPLSSAISAIVTIDTKS